MKKYIVYIGILAVGLILGWLLFGGSSNNEQNHNHNETSETSSAHWTCSMHPQIDLPEFGACPICGMDLIPLEENTDELTADQFKLSENAMALANIQTSIIGNSMTEGSTIKLSGKIVENEEANTVQTAHFSGRIEKLYISSVGEKINRGQLLAHIYSPELFAAQQELITATSLKESQPVLYNAVRNKLKLWKLSENQINSIEDSKKPISNFPVYANVSGVVSMKMVEEGNHIMEGAPLLKISNLNTVWAEFDVYENQISLFKKGQEVNITTNANPNKEYKTKVSFIDPVLNTKTRTVTLRAVLNNVTGEFKPGMFVEGEIENLKSSNNQALIIPATAILWTGKRSVVYIKTYPNEPVFEMREVTLGNKIGEEYEVLNGLNNGDEIVTNGTFTVDAAAQLKGKKSMMNKDGGKTTTGHEGHTGMKSMNTNISFGVRGNCTMCKSTIETAVNTIDGVQKAIWNVDTKNIEVTYVASKIKEIDIHNAIASSGYDTEKVDGDLSAYNKLPECCQYDHAMEMNISSLEKTIDN
ncbi:MAG: efflux RND transporter periplasmic adaptor subunit [Bacteroidetes bacterium]|nr:efflux RND transporter periplasmic adaptor subunit [Bacteroidota bacterium]